MVILDLFSLELAHLPMLHATHFRGKPMSQFKEKVFAACAKKEALFDESLGRYALRSMLAGAYLTMSTAVGIIGADVIATGIPALSRFVFAFIFAIGLVFVLIFNGELATSNMMFLTSGAYYGKIKWSKVLPSSSTVPSLILLVSLSWPGSSTNPSLSNI